MIESMADPSQPNPPAMNLFIQKSIKIIKDDSILTHLSKFLD